MDNHSYVGDKAKIKMGTRIKTLKASSKGMMLDSRLKFFDLLVYFSYTSPQIFIVKFLSDRKIHFYVLNGYFMFKVLAFLIVIFIKICIVVRPSTEISC